MLEDNLSSEPGLIILLGSGETSPTIRKVYDWLFRQIDTPVEIAILETPAGFEPNSDYVAGQIGDYFRKHLQNFSPQVSIVPARKKGTVFSPDDPSILQPLYSADVIMMGPGSPTYAARQLHESEAWGTLQARHRMGASLIFASATTIASSVHALPVYEIYKVGQDLHWQHGLDFFGSYGLSLIFVPHWNNNDGGTILDTSHCYVGEERYRQLLAMLNGKHVDDHPPDHFKHTIVGIDENTALAVNPQTKRCHVMGMGQVRVIHDEAVTHIPSGEHFSVEQLGDFSLPGLGDGIDEGILARTAKGVRRAAAKNQAEITPPDHILELVDQRAKARQRKDWAASDNLRDQISAAGWNVVDTPQGPKLEPAL